VVLKDAWLNPQVTIGLLTDTIGVQRVLPFGCR
jgi:hypothetical protein